MGLSFNPHTPSMSMNNPLHANFGGPGGPFSSLQDGNTYPQDNIHHTWNDSGFGMAIPHGLAVPPIGNTSHGQLAAKLEKQTVEEIKPKNDKKQINVNHEKSSPKEKQTTENKDIKEKGTKKKQITEKKSFPNSLNQNAMQALSKVDSEVDRMDLPYNGDINNMHDEITNLNQTGAGHADFNNYDFADTTGITNIMPNYRMPITTSPDDIGPNANAFMGATDAIMGPIYNTTGLNNTQLTHSQSHTNSFDSSFTSSYGSIHGSQTDEAMPSFPMGSQNFNNHGMSDQIPYGQQLPEEGHLEDGFFAMLGHQDQDFGLWAGSSG